MAHENEQKPTADAGSVERMVRPPAAWLVRALVTMAKRELADANATCGDCWPAGQEWHELGHTSQRVFMRRAREAAGIPHDAYRALIENVMATDEAEMLDALWAELERPNTALSGADRATAGNKPTPGSAFT